MKPDKRCPTCGLVKPATDFRTGKAECRHCEIIGDFWAIRKKGTLKFLPETSARGYTLTEPVAGPQPRLFSTHVGAAKALTAWAKGAWTKVGAYPGPEPVEGRSRNDMEIIELRLTIK